jgi:hypothetical protein
VDISALTLLKKKQKNQKNLSVSRWKYMSMCITVYYEKGRELLVFDFFFFYQFVKDGVHMRVIQDGHNMYVRTLTTWVEPTF